MAQAGRKRVGDNRTLRVDEDRWRRFEAAAALADAADAAARPARRRHRIDRSVITRELIDWFIGETDELPARPDPAAIAVHFELASDSQPA